VEAHALGGAVILKTEEGSVHRYVPSRDVLEEIAQVGSGAVWRSFGEHGAYADPTALTAVVISATETWRYELPGPPVWAGPVRGGGLLALFSSADGLMLGLWTADGAEPVTRTDLQVSPPGLVTAWGSQAAFRGIRSNRLVLLSLPELSVTGEPNVDGAVTALATSPSSHLIYAATTDRAGLHAVGRYTEESRRLTELDSAPGEIRSSLFGGSVLVFDGAQAWIVYPSGDRQPVPGDWRTDVPMAVGDGVLTLQDGRPVLWTPDAAGSAPVIGPAQAWWLAVRWRPPARPMAVAGREPGDSLASEAAAAEDGGGVAEGDLAQAGEAATREAPGDSIVRPGTPASELAGERPRDEPTGAPAEIPAGFYVIVGSSLNYSGIAELTRGLSEAGFPTRIQRHRDEANEIWYRALVGPHANREAAEAAVQALRRERGLQGWIAEIGPDVRPRSSTENR
jgi:cell division septation protein DedD